MAKRDNSSAKGRTQDWGHLELPTEVDHRFRLRALAICSNPGPESGSRSAVLPSLALPLPMPGGKGIRGQLTCGGVDGQLGVFQTHQLPATKTPGFNRVFNTFALLGAEFCARVMRLASWWCRRNVKGVSEVAGLQLTCAESLWVFSIARASKVLKRICSSRSCIDMCILFNVGLLKPFREKQL